MRHELGFAARKVLEEYGIEEFGVSKGRKFWSSDIY
jgi:hypothetical protein